MNVAIVDGNTICPVCETDKSWSFSVDRPTGAIIKDSVTRQNREVVQPNHSGHLEKLERKYRVDGGDWKKYQG